VILVDFLIGARQGGGDVLGIKDVVLETGVILEVELVGEIGEGGSWSRLIVKGEIGLGSGIKNRSGFMQGKMSFIKDYISRNKDFM
jgi:hypothetical protein